MTSPTDIYSPMRGGALTSDDTVTGDAVALDLPAAGVGLRLVSGLVDAVASIIVLVVTMLLSFVAAAGTDEALLHVAMVGSTAFSLVLVPTLVATASHGKSLGRWMTGLRVVRDDAGPIGAHHAFVRALLGFVEIYLLGGAPAFFAILLNSRGKRLGDMAAGTYVVRERTTLELQPPVVMPTHLADWAQRSDMTPLPVTTALAVRQFLGQAHDAGNEARARVGTDLARSVATHVAPPPPPGTHPEDFMAAVLAERGRRDALRLAREEAVRQRLRSRGGTAGR